MMNIGDNQMKAALLRAIPFAGLALALTVGPQASRAGQLVFDMQDLDNPSIAVNTVQGSVVTLCRSLSAFTYAECDAVFFPAAGTATVDVQDNVTGATLSFDVGDSLTELINDYYPQLPQASSIGTFYSVWLGQNFPFTSADFKDPLPGYAFIPPCLGACQGGDELVATYTYRDSGGSVLDTDMIHVITAAAAPEPGTASMLALVAAVGLVGARVRRRRGPGVAARV